VKTTDTVGLDEQRRVIRNGESGEVVGVRDGAALVRFGERASWIGGEELNKLRLAYMRHQQSGQGLTVEHVGGLLGGRSTTLEGGYVQASRARETALLLADLDSLGIPTEREVRPAPKTEDAVVEPLTLEQRRQLALEVIGERLATSDAKATAVAALAREAAREQAHAQWAEQEGRIELETVPQTSAHAPATDRQRRYAEALGVDIPEGATWVEASALLDAARGERIGGFAADRLTERGVDEEEIAAVLAQTESSLAERFEAEAEARDAQNAELVTDDEEKLRHEELAAELRSKLEDALVSYWNRESDAARWSDPALAEMSRENARSGLEWALRGYEHIDREAVERVRRQEHLDDPDAAQAKRGPEAADEQAPPEREEKAPEVDREAEVADAVRQLEQDWEDADREDRERAEKLRDEQERDRQTEVQVEPDEQREVVDDTPRAEPVNEEEPQPDDEQLEERVVPEASIAPQIQVEPAREQAAEQPQAPAPEATAEPEPEVE